MIRPFRSALGAATGALLVLGSSAWAGTQLVTQSLQPPGSAMARPNDPGSKHLSTVVFDADGAYLAAGGDSANAYVWKVSGLSAAAEARTAWADQAHRSMAELDWHGHRPKHALAWSDSAGPDFIALGDTSVAVRLFQGARLIQGGGFGWSKNPGQHLLAVRAVDFSPDGQRLATGSEDRTVRVWDLAGSAEPLRVEGHDHWVVSADFSPDGQRLATASHDGTARLWSSETGEAQLVLEHPDRVHAVSFSADGATLATACHDGLVRLWDAGTGELLRSLSGHRGAVFALALSPDGSVLASAGQDASVRLWDVGRGEQLHTLSGSGDAVRSVAFSSDGVLLAAPSGDDATQVLLRALEQDGELVPWSAETVGSVR